MIPRILALLGSVTLWAGYAFAVLCLALLVYSFSQDGARDVATWIISLGFGVTAVIIGYSHGDPFHIGCSLSEHVSLAANYKSFVVAQPQSSNLFLVR